MQLKLKVSKSEQHAKFVPNEDASQSSKNRSKNIEKNNVFQEEIPVEAARGGWDTKQASNFRVIHHLAESAL